MKRMAVSLIWGVACSKKTREHKIHKYLQMGLEVDELV